ncbi:hypothetical protein QAD02_010620 [Eretmocerus hayati]|uniref:Uncharacterized protein n=1 Tax=Eretmocerus hayati TaxID=131215 RepID=A0ACC2NUR3_9HYME|nr:hypothetical protein QAD02_010620 [Eretmocerus hayati]
MLEWSLGYENDEEPLNLQMLARKSFAFVGIPAPKVDVYKKIVEQIGGQCDDFPRYILSTSTYFNSLTDKQSTALYNVTFVRDCVDANRCLNIEQYRFGEKLLSNGFQDFEPCCYNFHNGQESCSVCDPKFIPILPSQPKKNIPEKPLVPNVIKDPNPILASKPKCSQKNRQSITKTIKTEVGAPMKTNEPYEAWESQAILDYIIRNNLFNWVKSPSLYYCMKDEGILKHRSAEGMRQHMVRGILPSLGSWNLPESVKRKLRKIRGSSKPTLTVSKRLKEEYQAKLERAKRLALKREKMKLKKS